MERKIGNRFKHRDVLLEVQKSFSGSCIYCYYYKKNLNCVDSIAIQGHCEKYKRSLNNDNVIFVEVEEENKYRKEIDSNFSIIGSKIQAYDEFNKEEPAFEGICLGMSQSNGYAVFVIMGECGSVETWICNACKFVLGDD